MAGLKDRTRYEPAEVEPRIAQQWRDSGLFHPDPEGTADENYSIAIPPPNVTGALHMGHALNGSIQDVLIRFNRMRGRRAKWILGTDHAGIATQKQVEARLQTQGRSRVELGREAFVDEVWKWREEYGGTIFNQFVRLGASCDYDDERFTLDDAYVRAVLKVFVDLYEQGLIYRDHYMVNWDPGPGHRGVRPRGRGARGDRHALLDRLLRRDRRRDRAARDAAGRHRRRGASDRRALPPPRSARR
jgi:valyl-tRNA synthetase